jgi:hypothetical protein
VRHELGDVHRQHVDWLAIGEPAKKFAASGVLAGREPAMMDDVVTHAVDVGHRRVLELVRLNPERLSDERPVVVV